MGIAAIVALLGLYIGERVKVKGENCPLKKWRCQRGGALVATTGKFVQMNAKANLFALC